MNDREYTYYNRIEGDSPVTYLTAEERQAHHCHLCTVEYQTGMPGVPIVKFDDYNGKTGKSGTKGTKALCADCYDRCIASDNWHHDRISNRKIHDDEYEGRNPDRYNPYYDPLSDRIRGI